MNYKEIIEELQRQEISVEEFAQEAQDTYENIGECQEVEQHGGEEQGSDWYSVKFFPVHQVYIKVSGYYSSYNGTDFEGWEDACAEVKPTQKTITVYE